DLADALPVKNKRDFGKEAVGRVLAASVTVERVEEIVDEDTGEVLDERREREVLLPAEHELSEDDYGTLKEAGIEQIFVRKANEDDESVDNTTLLNTLKKDPTHS